jgi:hypothetical protein
MCSWVDSRGFHVLVFAWINKHKRVVESAILLIRQELLFLFIDHDM